ncbi:MAG: hypothetical protein FWF51_09985, partial [Chitinivibrionia bacterium]|nr:hypothetical protein [Chitinivibrionia bacterium]
IAAMFAASVLFVGCGDPEPTPTPKPNPNPNPGGGAANSVLLDDFEEKEIDDEGNTGWTNQNSIANRKGTDGGTWYGYASTNGGKILAYDEDGNESNILDGNGSTTEKGMEMTLGTGSMIAALDVLDCPSDEDYYAAIVTPFIDDEDTKINLSGLRSVKIKGKIKGAMRVEIESPVTTDWANWGWSIGENSENSDYKNIDVELRVSAMTGPDWKLNPAQGRDEVLAEATVFVLAVDTSNDTRVDMEIDEIYLIFNDEGSIPSEFK